MNSFLIRRLLPFFVFAVSIELVVTLYMAISNFGEIDWNLLTLCKDLGILLLTTIVSFLFMIVPYVIYLTILPQKLQNGRLDKILTVLAYLGFVFLTCLEEASSVIFQKEFNILKETGNAEYIDKAQEIIISIHQSYPLFTFLSLIAAFSLVITWISRGFLLAERPAPHFAKRLFHLVIYALVCVLAFMNIDIEKLETNPDSFNSRLSEEGTYGLFNSFVKRNSRLMLLRNYPQNKNKTGNTCNV